MNDEFKEKNKEKHLAIDLSKIIEKINTKPKKDIVIQKIRILNEFVKEKCSEEKIYKKDSQILKNCIENKEKIFKEVKEK